MLQIKRNKETIAIPPAEIILELLEQNNITKKEFTSKMKMTEVDIQKLLSGELNLTQEIADKLEQYIFPKIPSSFWVNLEKIYRKDLKVVNSDEHSSFFLI